jgi:hypothetical protein
MGQCVVGMVSSYEGITQSDWLWKQTPHPFGQWGNIQMIARCPEPDFLLLYQFNFPSGPTPQPWWKSLRRQRSHSPFDPAVQFRNVPKDRRIYLLREPPLEEVVKKHKFGYQQAQDYCGYVSGPDDFAPIPDYMPAIWYVGNSFRELDEMPSPEKAGTCSWITSGINRTANHRKRLDFLRMVAESQVAVDVYGRNLPDWSQSQGELQNKWHGMAPYYYNLSIENYADNGWYVSEKLWDALLCWCLPIYYGGSAADKLLPPGSFVRLPSMDEKGLAYVQEITATPDAWYAAKDAIAEARQIILHKLNLLNWLSEYVAQYT